MLSARVTLFLLLISLTTNALAQDEHKLVWRKGNRIQWSDFKGPIDTTSKFHASTLCEVFANYKWTVTGDKYKLTFNTGSYLNTDRSWSVKEKQTPQLLRHEQLHFDIAELFARIYLRLLNKTVYTSTFKSKIEQINQANLRNLKIMQDLYDEQTDHSEDKYMQAKWEVYIAQLLNNPAIVDATLLRGPKK